MKRKKSELWDWFKTITIAIAIILFIKSFVFEFIQVEGDSMSNTFAHGEKLLINKWIYQIKEPHKGDIVVFKYPNNHNIQFIKRIIAIEGETIEINNGQVIVNGKTLIETYIKEKTMEDFEKRLVPVDYFFLLGDNRNNSKDSRFEDVGFISSKLIKGKAAYVIWPINSIRKII